MKQRAVILLMIFSGLMAKAQDPLDSAKKLIAKQDTVPGSSLNLKQCVDIAVKNNLLVRQSETALKTSSAYYTQSKDNLLPYINASGNQGVNIGRSINPYTNQYVDENVNAGNYGANSSLVLFSGLSNLNNIKANKYYTAASQKDYQQQKDNITLNVILAYLQVLSNQDLLDVAHRQAAVDSIQVGRLEIQNQEGSILPSALYDLRGQYATDKVNIVLAVNTLETSKVNLYQLLNIPYDRNANYERVAVDMNIADYGSGSDSIFKSALTIIPMVQAADLRVRGLEKGVAAARGKYYPTLGAYGSVSTNYSSIATDAANDKLSFGDQFKNNRYTSFGLQINIPILNYGISRNNVKLAKINLENGRNVATNTRNQLQQSVELAWQNMLSADEQFKIYREQADAYQASFRATETRFNEGVITSVDYIVSKTNVDRANVNLTAARYNYIFRTKILDYYQGRLSW